MTVDNLMEKLNNNKCALSKILEKTFIQIKAYVKL